MAQKKNFKLPTSELTKFYRTFSNIYGAILSTHAFDIIKLFYPSFAKSQLIQDLKARKNKPTKGYKVISSIKGLYIICRDYYSFDDLDRVFGQHANKPCFVLGPKEKYLAMGKPDYISSAVLYKNIYDYFSEPSSDSFASKICDKIATLIYLDEENTNFESALDELGISNTFERSFLLKEIEKIHRNSRLASNNGFTLEELSGNFGGNKIGVDFSLSDQIKGDILKGKRTIDEVKELIETMSMPDEVKDNVLKELEEFSIELRNHQA